MSWKICESCNHIGPDNSYSVQREKGLDRLGRSVFESYYLCPACWNLIRNGLIMATQKKESTATCR